MNDTITKQTKHYWRQQTWLALKGFKHWWSKLGLKGLEYFDKYFINNKQKKSPERQSFGDLSARCS